MRASLVALVFIAIIAAAFLGYYMGPQGSYATKTLTTTYTKTRVLVKNKTITLTYTKILTKTLKETTTSATTETTTYTKTIPETTTKTEEITSTITKYVTATTTATKTVVKAVIINPSTTKASLQCNDFSRYVLTAEDFACALSQSKILVNLSKALTVDGDPNLTAVRIAEWVANNIKYRTDESAFKVPNYVQKPVETLKNRFGDCEDLSLLEASLLFGTGLYDKVIIADISYSNIKVGHVEAGYMLGGTYFLVPWVNQTYPMNLLTDYYGYSEVAGAHINNVTLYVGRASPTGKINVSEVKLSNSLMSYVYPPPISAEDLNYLRESINNYLLSEGYNSINYPNYLDSLWSYLSNYLPNQEPPLKPPIAYFEYVIPIDWYSNKSPEWIAWRVNLVLNESLGSIQSGILPTYKGCLHAYLKEGKVFLEQVKFRPDGSTVLVKELTPSLILVILEPQACGVPEVSAELGDEFVIRVNSTSPDISVLFYSGSPQPVLGVVKKGYVLQGVPYITADYWDIVNGETVIKFSKAALQNKLSPGTYELIVWWNDKIAYVRIANLS